MVVVGGLVDWWIGRLVIGRLVIGYWWIGYWWIGEWFTRRSFSEGGRFCAQTSASASVLWCTSRDLSRIFTLFYLF
jgi:hypothetical protein